MCISHLSVQIHEGLSAEKQPGNLTEKAEISGLKAPAVAKECHSRLYSYSRLKRRKLLIALASHQGGGGGLISASAVPHCRKKKKKKKKKKNSVFIDCRRIAPSTARGHLRAFFTVQTLHKSNKQT